MFSRLHWHSCLINCCLLFRSEQLPPYSLQLVLLILFSPGVYLVKNKFLSPHASLHSGMPIKRMSQTLWVCETTFFFSFLSTFAEDLGNSLEVTKKKILFKKGSWLPSSTFKEHHSNLCLHHHHQLFSLLPPMYEHVVTLLGSPMQSRILFLSPDI